MLGKDAELAPGDAAWGALMSVTMKESARPNLVSPVVLGEAELRAIRAPTLLPIGEKEVIYKPVPTLERTTRRMPGLRGAIVPGAHHLAALACPDDVNARILQFLKSGLG